MHSLNIAFAIAFLAFFAHIGKSQAYTVYEPNPPNVRPATSTQVSVAKHLGNQSEPTLRPQDTPYGKLKNITTDDMKFGPVFINNLIINKIMEQTIQAYKK